MKILIVSTEDDNHARIVRWGLKQLGHISTLWDCAKFPSLHISSWSLSASQEARFDIGAQGNAFSGPFDVIWNRRANFPVIADHVHPDDVKVAKTESMEYLKNLFHFLGHQNTRWINLPAAARHADHKMVQLVAAKEAGFTIPATLIGNDFAELKAFFERHSEKVVFKAFMPGGWQHADGSTTVLRTSAITRAHLGSEDAIRACPGIYQELIEKDHELRVTVMGDQVLAGAILKQSDKPNVDWRYDGAIGKVSIQRVELSQEISERCLALCRALGLVFGCIDLIVANTGEVIFLEVNQAGQFLWKESADPSLPMLDAFCRFLVGDGAKPTETAHQLKLSGYYHSPDFREWQASEPVKSMIEDSIFTFEGA